MKKNGLFIVVEGADGAGTTTISKYLANEVSQRVGKNNVVLTHEPSGYSIGKFIRTILKKEANVKSEMAMLHLFIADRAEHTKRKIIPALQDGKVVISDRYYPSTVVYQSVKNGDVLKLFRYMDLLLHDRQSKNQGIIQPDLALYLRCEQKVLSERRKKRGEVEERYEDEEYQKTVVRLYDQFFGIGDLGFSCGTVDANKDLKSVKEKSLEIVSIVLDCYERLHGLIVLK